MGIELHAKANLCKKFYPYMALLFGLFLDSKPIGKF